MKYGVSDLLKDAMDAHDVHHSPKKILDDIKPEITNSRPDWSRYSINCILYHLNFWQDSYIKMLKDIKVDYDGNPSVISWSIEEERGSLDYKELLKQFYKGLEAMKELIDKVNIHAPVPSWENAPKIKLIVIVFQHNSYHLAQIYTLKKNLTKG